MFVVLVTHNALGVSTSLALVEQTIKKYFSETIGIGTIRLPMDLTRAPAHLNDRLISIDKQIDVVIFFEHVVEHSQFSAARHRILIPNPEWFAENDLLLAPRLTEMWHKTRMSLAALSGSFPGLRHEYIGFTSQDFAGGVPDYERFLHFRGASVQKQTEVVLAAWRMHPEWPELSLQSYVAHPEFLNFPDWLHWKNIRMKYCLLSPEEYRTEVAKAGVQLCPSSVEGFGHYLNEARSMGALVVTTNAPPMNELIDDTCGVLINPVRKEKQYFGVRHIIDVAGFEKAIQTVLQMPTNERRILGSNARQRFVDDRQRFETELVRQVRRVTHLQTQTPQAG